MDVDESLLTEEEGSPPHPHTAPSSQPAVSAVAQQEAPARKPRAPRPPWGNVKHPGLATVYLPHRALLHQQIRPSRVQLHPAEDQASTACGPFGWKELFEEIQRKAGLQRELSAMVARIIRQVDQTPPYKVQAKWAPLHYIDACWKGSALQLDPPPAGIENSANPSLQRGSSEKETAPGPQADEVANVVNRDEKAVGFSLAKALRREAALLHELKQVLRTRPMDDVDVYRLATPAGQVREYVQAYLYEVLPYRKIFGDNYNWKIFCRGLHDYLALGRADEISLLHVIAGTRFDAIPWLKQTDAERSQLFYAGFVLWIYQRLVNPLVNRLFYVTLTDFRRNEYVFYRREIWTDLVHAAVRERIDKQLWTVMLNQSKEEEDLLLSRSVVYRPRFLAKPNGIRPIMVCDPHPAAEEGKFLSLKTVRLVADFLAGRYSAKGCACQSDKDIQAAWQELRAERLQKQDTRPLLFLAFDISRAYENVKSSVIQGFLDQLSGLCERDGIRGVLLYDLFRARAAAGERRKPSARFRLIVPGEPIDEGFRHVKPQMMPVERAFRAVDQLMKPAIFKFKGKWYQFNSGVAQGAPASAWLLNVYLSALERETGFRAREDEMLVRFFDDVLFVTPCPERLQSFARTYAILYAKHGLKVAPRKTQTNFVTSDCREAPSLLHGGCTQEERYVLVRLAVGFGRNGRQRRHRAFRRPGRQLHGAGAGDVLRARPHSPRGVGARQILLGDAGPGQLPAGGRRAEHLPSVPAGRSADAGLLAADAANCPQSAPGASAVGGGGQGADPVGGEAAGPAGGHGRAAGVPGGGPGVDRLRAGAGQRRQRDGVVARLQARHSRRLREPTEADARVRCGGYVGHSGARGGSAAEVAGGVRPGDGDRVREGMIPAHCFGFVGLMVSSDVRFTRITDMGWNG
ncbi:uncharacterized protein LOC129602514 isoform X1 [Paramacrobiotus metropolitanus]|uniref:uncharacterized protein LOC129602514 isoform X1 n=1 Tax=Paramacrobiotus metropolitanus TaxID=2943436 RepID=UPI002445C5C3|nr:uncharacterized protein LOC129602514 isoform X1 [Paramacrobiotus metropolitanus]